MSLSLYTPQINVNLPCRKCGYNLRTLPREGVCPECGLAVLDTIQGLRATSHEIRKALFPALYLSWVKCFVLTVGVVLTFFDESMSIVTFGLSWVMDLIVGFIFYGVLSAAVLKRINWWHRQVWVVLMIALPIGAVCLPRPWFADASYAVWVFLMAYFVDELAVLVQCARASTYTHWAMVAWVCAAGSYGAMLLGKVHFGLPAAMSACLCFYLITLALRSISRSISIYPPEVAI